ncbi:MAG: hypothetical protein RL375_3236 [Pseudomonadota bacterium]
MRQPLPNTMKPIASTSDDEFVRLVQEAVALEDAPAHSVRAAVALWSAAAPRPVAAVGEAAWRLVRAVLSFDSWAQPALATGMRSTASETRHLLFNAQGRDVDLRISPNAGAFLLTGQILGPDERGVLELVTCDEQGPGLSRSAALDDMGEFRIDGVDTGTYQLTLRVGDVDIALPAIEVGGRNR